MYRGGLGVVRDNTKAVTYLLNALQSKIYRAAAAYELALIYIDNSTVRKDDAESNVRLNEAVA
jgi:TPR repeat protein